MVYKHFRVNCIFRVLLIALFIYLFFYLLFETELYATMIIVASFTIYQIYGLIYYVEKTNRDLTRFLDAIKHSDFSQSFSVTGLGSAFNDLKEAFNEVSDKFRKTRSEKEEHFRYLQIIVQHVGIGLIAFEDDGNVELINTAAKRLLRIPHLKNINKLESFSKPLVDILFKLKSGEKTLAKIYDNNELLQIAIYATEFKRQQQKLKLVSLQNIQSELEEKEMEAWQKLIRVLTHEIMNSVTPISSLASTVNNMLTSNGTDENLIFGNETSEETIADIRSAIQTIQKRSEGLIHFVDAYRSLTRIPKPNFQIFAVSELFDRIIRLMQTQIDDNKIHFESSINPESLELTADPELIEQVLINLLSNSIQSVGQQYEPKLTLTAEMDDRGRILIKVIDNGPGILKDVLEKVFIPFFTTKKGGTGIGLSLSRQIMRSHRGAISAVSKPNEETIFILRF